MDMYLNQLQPYWEKRFSDEGRIWGEEHSKTAEAALAPFNRHGIRHILVPGAGYGRNTRLFSSLGFEVTGVEISKSAYEMALEYDAKSRFHHASVLDWDFGSGVYEGIYCFNVLHLFRETERRELLRKCFHSLKNHGIAYFTVFSDREGSYGKGTEVESGTFESKPGRPVHYFSEEDLLAHFKEFKVIETGLAEDFENHGQEGPHTHVLRYITVQKEDHFEFDGEKYRKASEHQKEWGNRIISEWKLRGNERVLDLGCGDGVLTGQIAGLVPQGRVLGIDASRGMIETAEKLAAENLSFRQQDIKELDFKEEFDIIFSNATLHWVNDHKKLLRACSKALKDHGFLRFNFAGDGNCSHFLEVMGEMMAKEPFSAYFDGFQSPWYMPKLDEYKELLEASDFNEIRVWDENADRHFKNQDDLIKWIDQPSIVPYIGCVPERHQKAFRDQVVGAMIQRTRQPDGRCFETFRRINVYAEK